MRLDDIDFLIIGAAKSATTWLQELLTADPGIKMPGPELHYFSRLHGRGDNWYLAQFPKEVGDATVGEKSNSYLDHPAAAARIHAALPHVKLIAQLRNPVDRAYSDYCMLYRRGEASGDINRYLDPRKATETRFLQGGLYRGQLQRYFDLYPREKVLVLLYDDVELEPAVQLARVRGFLGLDQRLPKTNLQQRVKDKRAPILSPRFRRYLTPIRPIVRPFRETAGFKAAYQAISWKPTYPTMSEELRNRLGVYYEKEIELLSVLLERDLSTWLIHKRGIALGR